MSKSNLANKVTKTTSTANKADSKEIEAAIKNRQSNELVIALCGAIGSGVKELKDVLHQQLNSYGYEVVHIRVSDIIATKSGTNVTNVFGFERYKSLQDAGDTLRGKHGHNILAACSIEQIAIERAQLVSTNDDEISHEAIRTEEKIAYIIDQLKHPEEEKLLRLVYPHNFYLIGIFRTERERRLNLEEEKIDSREIA